MISFFLSIPTCTIEEAFTKINNKDVAFIDVREKHEYEAEHAEGCKNIPLSSLNETHAKELADHKEVYVLCRSGSRSAQATKYLQSHGVKAISVSGGTLAWIEHGLPTEKK